MRLRPILPALAIAAACLLAACGKVGAPSPPGPPSAIIYPRSYPAVPAR